MSARRVETVVHADAAAAAADIAERLAAAAARGEHIALTGGSSPKDAYARAAELDADWSGAHLWFGDERCVPPGHEHSNYAMAEGALLRRIAADGVAVHRMKGELGPDDGAADYERELGEHLGEGTPALDLVLLGLGPDAHCASLFPREAALGERERPVTGVQSPGMAPLVPRITLTLPALDAAREVVFLVTGEGKADAVRRAFGGPPTPDAPASLLAPGAPIVLVLDEPAAAQLEGAR